MSPTFPFQAKRSVHGYGSRFDVEKGAILDWSGYYFLHLLLLSLHDRRKRPALPSDFRIHLRRSLTRSCYGYLAGNQVAEEAAAPRRFRVLLPANGQAAVTVDNHTV
ncbi:hypothetical protein LINPERPRIM_LOCUS18711 [Linum perenne]